MARRRVLYGLALLASVLFQIYSTTYLAAFLLALAVLLPILSLLISLPAVTACRVSLLPSQPGVLREGEALWIVTVGNGRRLPLSRITVQLCCRNRMTGAERRTSLRLSGGSEPVQLALPADTGHCGMLVGQILKVHVCDCLGLFSMRCRCASEALMPVQPLPDAVTEQALPELPRSDGTTLRVRPGAGSGEDYDLRPYRPGDSVRLIHWKLSSKRDELIFREVLEAQEAIPTLLLDHVGTPEQMDALLDRAAALCGLLLEQQRHCVVCWLEPVTGELREYPVGGRRELDRCMMALLSDPAPTAGHTLSRTPAAAAMPGQLRVALWAEEAAS